MHPKSVELIKINALGCEIWKAMTGTVTTEEIVLETGDLYKEVGKAFNLRIDTGDITKFKQEHVIPFVMAIYEKGFIEFSSLPSE